MGQTGVERPGGRTRPTTRRPGLLLAVPAGLVLAVAAVALPWATVRAGGLPRTVAVRGGAPGAVLAVIALGGAVVATVGWATGRTRGAATALVVIGCLAVVGSGVVALHGIHRANSYPLPGHGVAAGNVDTDTSYGVGVLVGAAASVVILVVGVLQRSAPVRTVAPPTSAG